ncbi:MAG: HupE/UreJ family protein [Rhizobiaceae bacterium]
MNLTLRFLVCCVLLCSFAFPVGAHFLLNLNVRILHVEHLSDGVRVYLRTPMPYVLADKVGPPVEDGLPAPAPFTTNRMEEGKLVHYVDPVKLSQDPNALGAVVADGFRFVSDGKRMGATVEQTLVHRIGSHPPFATLDEARAVFATGRPYSVDAEPLYVGDAVTDVILRYTLGAAVYDYEISSTLDPGLPGQENTANLILDYGPGGTKVFRARGLLAEPIAISRSAFSAVFTFIKEGFRHILEGLDHVLFVLCLVLGATAFRSLVWRVTGFTIGHSVTLTAGFFGFVPSGAWFVPAVETGIALSIIYAALIAIWPRAEHAGTERSMFLVTCGIGLLHGLGFSFVLHKILQVTSPDIWQSLLAFNIGVEIGQLTVVMATWPLFWLVAHLNARAWRIVRWAVATGCVAVAAFWALERLLGVLEAMAQSN